MLKLVDTTPNTTTMDDLAQFLERDLKDTLKSVLYMVDADKPKWPLFAVTTA